MRTNITDVSLNPFSSRSIRKCRRHFISKLLNLLDGVAETTRSILNNLSPGPEIAFDFVRHYSLECGAVLRLHDIKQLLLDFLHVVDDKRWDIPRDAPVLFPDPLGPVMHTFSPGFSTRSTS